VSFSLANEQEAGIVRHLTPFVEIQRDRIRLLDAVKPRRTIAEREIIAGRVQLADGGAAWKTSAKPSMQ
jgi:hypothetical protein